MVREGFSMKEFSIIGFAALLSGCASTSTREPPIVDMRGVDQQKYANDLHDCTEQSQGFITFGAPISRCLTQRGYTVTVPKT
jgi:hypothetical protein